MKKEILKYIQDPLLIFSFFLRKISPLIKNDELYIKLEYFFTMKKILCLSNPKTFNEKLQWLKLNCKKDEYTSLVDKYEVKKNVAKIIGEEHIIPTLGVWNNFDDIEFENLPDKFVLKCTHDSGGVAICNNKSIFDKRKVREKLDKSMRKNYFYEHREYVYKNVKPRIIAEKYMVDESGEQLKDYKFFCFDGEVKALFIATDRGQGTTKFDFFDSDFNHLPIKQHYPNTGKPIAKPAGFEEMKKLATQLSQGFPHVRIDFYDINGKIYFGELTFFHFNGTVPFEPKEWDMVFGNFVNLSKCEKDG